MSHKLLTRFVFSGMQKNKRVLLPYLAAGSLTVMIFYILNTLAFCPYIYVDHKEAFYGAQTIAILLEIAGQIVGVFSIFFIVYANQFVIKGRKKEMALYGVLGMSKKNITFIMALESLLHAVICIFTGMLAGTFLSKLMLLVLYKIIGQAPVSGLIFSARSVKNTLIIFVIIYASCLIYNVSCIRVGNPIELLHSNTTGEREPKVKIIPLIIGILTLAGGYWLAITANSVGDALGVMFVSILLVIIATYCLFTSGSIFLLKLLKRNQKYYLKTRNFISVSNLMFRMKHNAAGLASICVLSTGVIILLTCGSSLMMLGEKNINDKFPTDVKIEPQAENSGMEEAYTDAVRRAAEAADIPADEIIYRQFQNTVMMKNGAALEPMTADGFSDLASCVDLYFVTLEDYNRYAGTELTLAENEILICRSDEREKEDRLTLRGKDYEVAGEADRGVLYYIFDPTMSLFEREIIVLRDEEELNRILQDDTYIGNTHAYSVYIGFNTQKEISEQEMTTFTEELNRAGYGFETSLKAKDRMFFYNLYGGAFFVGIFLAVLFLLATVLIIYYKQTSEGFEDQRRFKILSQVGLTEKEAKSTIKRQVMILFFLPVAGAILHVVVASKVLRLFLRMVLIVDGLTFAISIAVVCMLFIVVYALVYKATSGQYYRIVYGNER